MQVYVSKWKSLFARMAALSSLVDANASFSNRRLLANNSKFSTKRWSKGTNEVMLGEVKFLMKVCLLFHAVFLE
jgi:hypothetical protein